MDDSKRGSINLISSQNWQSSIDYIISEHTKYGTFTLSSGKTSSVYIDCRAAIAEYPDFFRNWIQAQLYKYPQDVRPVGTGVSGSLLMALSGRRFFVYNNKPHGLPWSPDPPKGSRVVLLDDVVTTGKTLQLLRNACAEKELEVVGTIIIKNRGVEDELLNL